MLAPPGAPESGNKNGEALLKQAPPHWGVRGGLVVELESELNLARIVGSIARRTDFAECRAVIVAGVGDCHHAVLAEIRCVEVRVVADVEDFRPELQAETLLDRKVLEERQVHSSEARSGDLRYAAKCGYAGKLGAAGRRIGNGVEARVQNAGLDEGAGIAVPVELAVGVVVQAQMQILAGVEHAAAQTGSGLRRTGQRDGLASLEGGAPVDAPAAYQLVRESAGI